MSSHNAEVGCGGGTSVGIRREKDDEPQLRATMTENRRASALAGPKGRFGFHMNLRRPDAGEDADRVGYMELFFDLVFVYAITALAELLVGHQTATELIATIVMGGAMWWTWISTAWVTNWLDPDRGLVRGLLIALMAASLILSGTIGEVLHGAAPVFAITLVVVNVGRPIFTVLALRRDSPTDAANFVKLTIWTIASAPIWIIGAFSPDPLVWWAVALVLDLLAPLTRFAVPGLGRTPLHAWRIRGAHFAERVSLFVLIALGESIALIGEHIAEALPSPVALASLGAALTHTILLWFLFFNRSESLGSQRIRGTSRAGGLARNTYSYTAALLIMGIIFSAVATDVAFRQAELEQTPAWTAGLLVGANVLCLTGNLLFRLSLRDTALWTHLPAIAVSVALFPARLILSPVALEWAVVVVLGAVVAADAMSASRRNTQRTAGLSSSTPNAASSL